MPFVVTDKHNRIVTNLKADDFVVYEDGVAQKLASFHLYRGAPLAKEQDPAIPAAAGSAAPVAPAKPSQPATLTILLLDYSTVELQNQKLVREASAKYVREKLQPNERMAVFALGTSLRFLTDFTDDRDTLMAALKTSDITGSAVAADRADFDRDAIRNPHRDRVGVADLLGLPQPSLELDIVGFFESLGFDAAGRAERLHDFRAPECGSLLSRDHSTVMPNLAPQYEMRSRSGPPSPRAASPRQW